MTKKNIDTIMNNNGIYDGATNSPYEMKIDMNKIIKKANQNISAMMRNKLFAESRERDV